MEGKGLVLCFVWFFIMTEASLSPMHDHFLKVGLLHPKS